MKKTSLFPALLFLVGVLVGGTAVFFFLRPGTQATQTSEPVPEAELSDEPMPSGDLEETEEIPVGGGATARPEHEIDSE